MYAANSAASLQGVTWVYATGRNSFTHAKGNRVMWMLYRVHVIQIGMSTTCTFPLSTDDAFRLAARAGYDAVEVMVTAADSTRNAQALNHYRDKYDIPIASIHAPVLLFTHFVWGTSPAAKLERTVELARAVDASTVVVHPPFRWQARYAKRFTELVRQLETEHGVTVAVENMFPWRVQGDHQLYLPGTDPTQMDVDSITLDFSHAALSHDDALQMARRAGDRLKHVHLCDGSSSVENPKLMDEHLLPGHGSQPVAETLQYLADSNWQGSVIAEINTRSAGSDIGMRFHLLQETLAFARQHLKKPVSL